MSITQEQVKYLVDNAAVNPADIRWPTDEHGITSDLKKAIIAVAMAAKGNSDKEAVIIATLQVGFAHIKKRVVKDAEEQLKRIERMQAAAEARRPLERFKKQNYKKEAA